MTFRAAFLVGGSALSLAAMLSAGAQAFAQQDVPPVLSAPEVVAAILDAANLKPQDILADLGCGDGRIALAAVRAGARAICVEKDSRMLDQARRNAEAARVSNQIVFRLMDLRDFVKEQNSIAAVDVVVIYLTPELNALIAGDLRRYLKSGARVISHAYPVSDWRPTEIRPVWIRATGNTSRLYVYDIK